MKTSLGLVAFLFGVVATVAACSDDSSPAAMPADPAAARDDVPGDTPNGDASPAPPDASKPDASKPDASKPPPPVLPLVVNAQMSLPQMGSISGTPSAGFRIVLSDRGPLCVAGDSANATTLELDIASTNTPLATGTYPVTRIPKAPLWVEGLYYVTDAACVHQQPLFHPAESGSIVISAITAEAVTGTYDVTFDNGARLSGAFDAPLCDVTTIIGPKVCAP